MREDGEKMAEGENEIAKENTMLREQYEALVKEIDEKTGMMEKAIAEKEETAGSIENEMTSKIATQEEEIKKQVAVYAEQGKLKQTEERELVKVLTDYKCKYEEF